MAAVAWKHAWGVDVGSLLDEPKWVYALGQTEGDGLREGKIWFTDSVPFLFCFCFLFPKLAIFSFDFFVGRKDKDQANSSLGCSRASCLLVSSGRVEQMVNDHVAVGKCMSRAGFRLVGCAFGLPAMLEGFFFLELPSALWVVSSFSLRPCVPFFKTTKKCPSFSFVKTESPFFGF